MRSSASSFLARPDARALVAKGCATPDHVIRTKPTALFFDPVVDASADASEHLRDAAAVTIAFENAVTAYQAEYDAYFDTNIAAKKITKQKLDSVPCVVLVPGLGIVSVAATKKEAAIAADIYEHTISIMVGAERVGAYSPASMSDLFDVEYWSLEQAKLKKATPAALARSVALVTGAASGIGLATAALFLENGAHVVLVDRDEAALLKSTAALARKYGSALSLIPGDVTRAADVAAAFAHAVRTYGGVDVVVSNAGNAPEGLLHEASGAEKLRASLELNLLSHNTVLGEAVAIMRLQRQGGCLIVNASKSAFNQGPGFGPYAVAKSALVSLVRQYAVDLGEDRIRVNAVNADRIRTGLFAGGVLESRAKARGLSADDYFKSNLLKREVTAAGRGRSIPLPCDGKEHDRMRRHGRWWERRRVSALSAREVRVCGRAARSRLRESREIAFAGTPCGPRLRGAVSAGRHALSLRRQRAIFEP